MGLDVTFKSGCSGLGGTILLRLASLLDLDVGVNSWQVGNSVGEGALDGRRHVRPILVPKLVNVA
jgi:hypothetical protein